jgi:PAS domain S-box-containing protein
MEAPGEFSTARQRVAVRFARMEKPSTAEQIGLRATRNNVEERKFELPEWLDEVTGILETLNQGVVINDACSRILFANEIFQRMIGRSTQELVGHVVTEFYPPADVPALVKHIERRQKEGLSQFEFFVPQLDGGRLPVLVTARQIEDRDGGFFAVITATDITEQKRAENALREVNIQLEQRHREIEEDLILASRVQQSLSPKSLIWGKSAVETFYQPVRTIGGDFGLVTPGEDYLSIMVCDVSGHGIGSALVANRIYTETMSQIESGAALTPMLRHLNRFVMQNIGGSIFYFTLAAARLNQAARLLEFAGACHPPAMIVQPGEMPRLLESRSAILGLLHDAVDAEATIEVPVQAGDRVVIYTDGFTESFDAQKEMLGVEGLIDIVRETSKLPLAQMKQEIVDRVAAWRSGSAADDMSLVVVEVR